MPQVNNNEQSHKKWHAIDIFILALQIVLPLIAIVIAWKVPTGSGTGQISEDIKLSIVGLGLLVPLVLTQVSITVGQNKSETGAQEIERKIHDLHERVKHIDPMLERAFLSGNDRVLRFALRRMGETNKTINEAVSSMRSDYLRPKEYFDELEYLATLITEDKSLRKKKFTGEIWAMTSFAPDEWMGEYTDAWNRRLAELVDLGIKTQRLCVMDDTLIRAISQEPFFEPSESEVPTFREFMGLLKGYYKTGSNRNVARHYIVKDSANDDIKNARGFFAVVLSSGEMHILTGEKTDIFNVLSAYALFDEREIRQFYSLCKKYMVEENRLEKYIAKYAKVNGFIKYLSDNGISLQ